MRGWSCAANAPSTARARSTRRHWKRWRPGPSSTEPCGKRASTRWTSTSGNSNRRGGCTAMTDAPAQDAVVIERDFDAPVDLVWKLWTDPEHFKHWYGPDGASIQVARMDVRAGGHRLVCME